MGPVRRSAADPNGEIGNDGCDQVERRVGGFREYSQTAGGDPDDDFKGGQADGGEDRGEGRGSFFALDVRLLVR